MTKITPETWRQLYLLNHARIWDGRRYCFLLTKISTGTCEYVWREVEMIVNVSRPYTNEFGQQTR